MRVVAGEHQAVGADPADHVGEVLAVVRLLHRLCGQPHVLAQIFGWRTLHVRNLVAHPRPIFVEPPRQRRQPGEPGLDDNDLQRRETLEHPLEDHARERSLARCGVRRALLQIERWPAAVGHWPPAVAEHMDRHWQIVLAGGLEDRPVTLLAERLAGAAQHQHLHVVARPGAAVNLSHRRLAVLVRDDD